MLLAGQDGAQHAQDTGRILSAGPCALSHAPAAARPAPAAQAQAAQAAVAARPTQAARSLAQAARLGLKQLPAPIAPEPDWQPTWQRAAQGSVCAWG